MQRVAPFSALSLIISVIFLRFALTSATEISFAASADIAKDLYHKFNKQLESYGIIVKEGVFGAEMDVELINKGPFTIVITEKDL